MSKGKKEIKRKQGRPKQGNTRRQFKNEKNDILEMITLGSSYGMVKNYFGMSNSEWNKFYEKYETEIKQARATRQLDLIFKTNDLSFNRNNFNALRMLLINETELQDKVEQKIDSVQSINIVDNTDDLDEVETFGGIDEQK